jgi:hypothetical protein
MKCSRRIRACEQLGAGLGELHIDAALVQLKQASRYREIRPSPVLCQRGLVHEGHRPIDRLDIEATVLIGAKALAISRILRFAASGRHKDGAEQISRLRIFLKQFRQSADRDRQPVRAWPYAAGFVCHQPNRFYLSTDQDRLRVRV